MFVGFTGTQRGLTSYQRNELASALASLKAVAATTNTPAQFHHGDCIGADYEAHYLARKLGWHIVVHPPENTKKEAWCIADERRPSFPYLVRNHNIVRATDILIACPRTGTEEQRSGTWATVRYARKIGRPVFILEP